MRLAVVASMMANSRVIRNLRPDSDRFPLVSGDATLAQYFGQQFATDVATMRIGDPEPCATAFHVLMLSTGKRTFESELTEMPDEFGSSYRPELGHQAALSAVI